MKNWYLRTRIPVKPGLAVGLAALLGIGSSLVFSKVQSAIAQELRIFPITFVKTSGSDATVTTLPGYKPRFSKIVGSGALLVNSNDEVTGYYFAVGGLEPSQTLAYHFHRDNRGITRASCEGEKGVVSGEVAGDVLTNLSEVAPLKTGSSGVAMVGGSSQPVQLPKPVPLQDIGYINIHALQGEGVGPGMVCANVRLNAGGFKRR